MSALLALAERCETGAGSYSLSREIGDACNMPERYEHPGSENPSHRPYTTSVDAALALLPLDQMAMLDLELSWEPPEPGVHPAIGIRWYPAHKSGPDWHAMTVSAATIPLTICAAALRARAQTESLQP